MSLATSPCAWRASCRPSENRDGWSASCSRQHAVDHQIDGEAKPLVDISGDVLLDVPGDEWKPVGGEASEVSRNLLRQHVGFFLPELGLDRGVGHLSGHDVRYPCGLLSLDPSSELDTNFWNTGWRLVLLINVPIGLIALPFAIRALPWSVSHPDLKLDIGGVGMVGLALVAIIYPLIQGQTDGWPAWTFVLLAVGVGLLAAFVRYQRRRSHDALIEPSLLTNRRYLSGIAVMLFLFGAFGGLLLCVSLFGQLGEGWSPIHAGLSLTPMVIGLIAGMVVSGMFVERLGRHLLHIGIVGIAAGATVLALMLTGEQNASTWDLAPGLLLVGTGVGTVLGQIIQFILAAVSMNEVGTASGVMEASQQLSTSLGVAILGTIFFAAFKHNLATDALRITAWLCLLPLAAAFALIFLLPKNAREGSDS